jgi:hypothetical protein
VPGSFVANAAHRCLTELWAAQATFGPVQTPAPDDASARDMSHACMFPPRSSDYLITTTRVTVALLPSLVAVTVTVPRSTP